MRYSILFCLLFLMGCGEKTYLPPPKTVAVSGKVTLASGTVINNGRVIFKPKVAGMQEGIGDISPDGKYTLSCYVKGDGIVPGDYIVVIESINRNVPAQYRNEKTSNLVISVAQAGDYPISLK